MAQSLQKIYHRAADAINQGCDVSGEDVLREILDICTYSLRVAHEGHCLLTAHPELRSSSPVPFPAVPHKAQRGRPKKRSSFSCGAAFESRKRGSYVPVTVSTPLEVAHSPNIPSNGILENIGVNTLKTWDSSLSISEFQDTADPNTMQLDLEATDTKNSFSQAFGKIRDICAFTLRMSNGNEAMSFKEEMIPSVGPKTKHCKPRRRGGMSGPYMVGPSSGSYFPSTPEPSSPTESALIKPNYDYPYQPHDIINPDQNADPFVNQLSNDQEEDNLQSEMIELGTITGSREPSPSSANPSILVDNIPSDHYLIHMPVGMEPNLSLDDTAQGVPGEKVMSVCSASDEVAIEVNKVSDSGDGGKRKELETDEVGSAEGMIEGEFRDTNGIQGGGIRDDVQKKYKRQPRTVPKMNPS